VRRRSLTAYVALAVATTLGVTPATAPAAGTVSPRVSPPASSAPAGARPSPSPSSTATKVASVAPRADPPSRTIGGDDLPLPPEDDRDRPRILRIQEMLRDIVHGAILRRLHVGMRVVEARSGRLLFGRRGAALMDPASNQKVLATTTAILRLGADWRFRTELAGSEPDNSGVITGDLYLRGSGDPTVRSGDLAAMASRLARRGVRQIDGGIVADPRRIGAEDLLPESGATVTTVAAEASVASAEAVEGDGAALRPPLVVNRGFMQIRVRPGVAEGGPVEVTTIPSDDSFEVRSSARTRSGAPSKIAVNLGLSGGKIRVDVSGRIAPGHAGIGFRRKVPHQALYAGMLLRSALVGAGIAVRDPARIGSTPASATLVDHHESDSLGILLRKINKDSDNDQAERVLEAAGAEVYGGSPSPEKGVRLLREVIGELGLPPGSYVSRNGSGLGHANRITADAMARLLRALYLDPRIGPEILQSLSVGGVDGTTRNRFKGSPAAKRVRAKTGTLIGKSCLSGYVGDGSDVLVFSILVDGLMGKGLLRAVRGAQVGAVNAMMRYVRDGTGQPTALPPSLDQPPTDTDYENGDDIMDSDGELGAAVKPGEDPVDAVLNHERESSTPKTR
jgi:D-alanyl-D-alanine carboxypeptidase/D-alanyl-D-alanine-endopeptidase (penicillin-binding protein 4)